MLIEQLADDLRQRAAEVGDEDDENRKDADDECSDQARSQRLIAQNRDLQRDQQRAEPEKQSPGLDECGIWSLPGISQEPGDAKSDDANQGQPDNEPDGILNEKCAPFWII